MRHQCDGHQCVGAALEAATGSAAAAAAAAAVLIAGWLSCRGAAVLLPRHDASPMPWHMSTARAPRRCASMRVNVCAWVLGAAGGVLHVRGRRRPAAARLPLPARAHRRGHAGGRARVPHPARHGRQAGARGLCTFKGLGRARMGTASGHRAARVQRRLALGGGRAQAGPRFAPLWLWASRRALCAGGRSLAHARCDPPAA